MSTNEDNKLVCGIVMPISAIDGCSESHWSDVHEILGEAIDDAGFEANLVSNADDVGIIQKRIIQNLYDNPIVVCNVSGKNPNVMFELGMRLAFDRPTIIVKDDKTSYSFDTSPIEHLEYLRFSRIVEFKEKLTDKIKKTYEKSNADASYTTFLKHFGEFKVAKIEHKEVSGQEFIIDELKSLRLAISRLDRAGRVKRESERLYKTDNALDVCLNYMDPNVISNLTGQLASDMVNESRIVSSFEITKHGSHEHLIVIPQHLSDRDAVRDIIRQFIPDELIDVSARHSRKIKDGAALNKE
jgi:hypothetical protein